MKTFSFKEVEQAYISQAITLEQFIEVLVDNFGRKKTRKILEYNMKISMKKDECKKEIKWD